MQRLKAFLWGTFFFCTMDGFFRILEKTSSQLICTRLYCRLLELCGRQPFLFTDIIQIFSPSLWIFTHWTTLRPLITLIMLFFSGWRLLASLDSFCVFKSSPSKIEIKYILVMSPSRAGSSHSSSWRIFSSARLCLWPFSLQLGIENWLKNELKFQFSIEHLFSIIFYSKID